MIFKHKVQPFSNEDLLPQYLENNAHFRAHRYTCQLQVAKAIGAPAGINWWNKPTLWWWLAGGLVLAAVISGAIAWSLADNKTQPEQAVVTVFETEAGENTEENEAKFETEHVTDPEDEKAKNDEQNAENGKNVEEPEQSKTAPEQETKNTLPQQPAPPADPCAAGTWAGYSDVPNTHQFYPFICPMARDGIFTGYAATTFAPSATVNRAMIASVTFRSFGFSPNTGCAPFADVPASHPQFVEITTMRCTGVVGGYPDNTYRPNNPVERQTALVYLIRGKTTAHGTGSIISNYIAVTQFPDVPSSHQFYDFAMKARANGYISGNAGALFHPADVLIRQDMARMFQPAR